MRFNCGITGHTGVLGSEIIKKKFDFRFSKFNGDLTKKKDIKKWINNNDINIIFHFAAVVPTHIVKDNFSYANKVNVIGTKNLINEAIKQKKLKWFLFSSTSHVYNFSKKKITEKTKTKPLSKYGLTKLKAEKYIQKKLKNKIPFCIARIFSFSHKKQASSFVIPSIIKKAKTKNKKIIFSNLEHYRDFLSTSDICNAIKILYKNKATGIYNIGSGKKVLISDIVKIILRKYKKKYLIKKNKNKTCLVADIKKIKKLNWKPKKNINKTIAELL